jgi:hypothetical protein
MIQRLLRSGGCHAPGTYFSALIVVTSPGHSPQAPCRGSQLLPGGPQLLQGRGPQRMLRPGFQPVPSLRSC